MINMDMLLFHKELEATQVVVFLVLELEDFRTFLKICLVWVEIQEEDLLLPVQI